MGGGYQKGVIPVKRQITAVLLALALIVFCLPGASAVNAQTGAEVTNESFYTHAYVVKGSTVGISLRYYSGTASGGYESLLFRAALDGTETQDELNAIATKLVKDNAKSLESYGGWYYNAPVDMVSISDVDTSRLTVGTYLLAGYVLRKSGSSYKADTETVCGVAIHVVAEEKPIDAITYFLCREDGTIVRQLEPGDSLEYSLADDAVNPIVMAVTSPADATERIVCLDNLSPDGAGTFLGSSGREGHQTYQLSPHYCGSAVLASYICSYTSNEERTVMSNIELFVPCYPKGRPGIITKATCTSDGLWGDKCRSYGINGCETIFDRQVLPATGHYVTGSGQISQVLIEPKATKPGLAIARCSSCRKPNLECRTDPIFRDTVPDGFYSDPLDHCYARGWVSGINSFTFSPLDTCNRAQIVTFLWRAAGCPDPQITGHTFTDVEPGAFYEKALLWAVENEITTGTSHNTFSPMGICNRAQVVTFLYRSFASPAVETTANPFTDVPGNGWYTVPVLWAIENGITNGVDATHFGPTSPCNRAQVVTFLYRAYH